MQCFAGIKTAEPLRRRPTEGQRSRTSPLLSFIISLPMGMSCHPGYFQGLRSNQGGITETPPNSVLTQTGGKAAPCLRWMTAQQTTSAVPLCHTLVPDQVQKQLVGLCSEYGVYIKLNERHCRTCGTLGNCLDPNIHSDHPTVQHHSQTR